MSEFPIPKRGQIQAYVAEDGSVVVQWSERGAEEDWQAPAGTLQVWPGGENGRPTSVRLTMAEGLTPTALHRFPWAKMLGTAEAQARFYALQEQLPNRVTEFVTKLVTGRLDPEKEPQRIEEVALYIWGVAKEESEQRFNDAVGQLWGVAKTEPRNGRRPGRKGYPDDFYKKVASRYEELRSQGKTNPTTLIAREESVSRDAVSGWVRIARKRGYLPPALRGRAG